MNKIFLSLLSGVLLLSTVACSNTEKTSSSAPDSTNQAATQTMDRQTAQNNQSDATSETRRRQLNSDIRSSEQRNKIFNGSKTDDRSDDALKSEVRSKLEANLPASALAVDSKDGAIKVSGTVIDQQQVGKIEPLAKQINGVKSVVVNVKVDPSAKPAPPKPGSQGPLKDQTGKK